MIQTFLWTFQRERGGGGRERGGEGGGREREREKERERENYKYAPYVWPMWPPQKEGCGEGEEGRVEGVGVVLVVFR